jgi:hypothetical protein
MMDDKAVFVDTWGWMALGHRFVQVGIGFSKVP